MLLSCPIHCVIILDFTKFNQPDEGSVQCLIFAMMYAQWNADSKTYELRIDYYDFLAQSTTPCPVKQVFPYVKVNNKFLGFLS